MAVWHDWMSGWHKRRRSDAIARAMYRGDTAEVERLMKPRDPTYGGEWVYSAASPLHKAVMIFDNETETVVEGDLDVLRRLIVEGANLEMKDEYGQTALLLAASNGLVNVVRLLLESGANVNAKNESGQTSYQMAIEDDNAEIVALLRRYGAVVKARR